MNFCQKHHYGKDFFYPSDSNAKKFVEAFPHSSGKRKSLTRDQMHILKDVGVPFIIRESLNQPLGEDNATTGNKGL